VEHQASLKAKPDIKLLHRFCLSRWYSAHQEVTLLLMHHFCNTESHILCYTYGYLKKTWYLSSAALLRKKEKRTVDSSSHSHSSGQSVLCCQPKKENGLEYVSNPRLFYTSKLAFFFFSVFFPSEVLLCYKYFFHWLKNKD